MEPTTALVTGGAITLAAMALVLGALVMGRVWGLARGRAEREVIQGLLDIARATLEAERQRFKARATGAARDHADDVSVLGTTDADSMLLQFPGPDADAAPDQQGGETESEPVA